MNSEGLPVCEGVNGIRIGMISRSKIHGDSGSEVVMDMVTKKAAIHRVEGGAMALEITPEDRRTIMTIEVNRYLGALP